MSDEMLEFLEILRNSKFLFSLIAILIIALAAMVIINSKNIADCNDFYQAAIESIRLSCTPINYSFLIPS